MDPRNPYGTPAPLIFKALAVAIVSVAQLPVWIADWRLVRAEERDARRERARAAWDSIGCLDWDDDE